MAEAEVKASPEGVPGALRDPSAVRAEDLQYPGAGGTPVNGYLVRPAGAAAPPCSCWPPTWGAHAPDVVVRNAIADAAS